MYSLMALYCLLMPCPCVRKSFARFLAQPEMDEEVEKLQLYSHSHAESSQATWI